MTGIFFTNEPKGWEQTLIGRLVANNSGDIILRSDSDEFLSIVSSLRSKLCKIGTYSPSKPVIPPIPEISDALDFDDVDAILDDYENGTLSIHNSETPYTRSR